MKKSGHVLRRNIAAIFCVASHLEAALIPLVGRRVCQICEKQMTTTRWWQKFRSCLKGICTEGHSRHSCSGCLSAFQSSQLIEVYLPATNSVGEHVQIRCISIAPYEGTAREAICALKYFGKIEISEDLARVLMRGLEVLSRPGESRKQEEPHKQEESRKQEVTKKGAPNLVLIPVPLHRDKLKERSFNQSELIARLLARHAGIKCDTRTLIRRRSTTPQYGLTKLRRAANVHGAFSASSRVAGKHVILIDDVLTSGATAIACSEALLEAGAQSVAVLSLARAILRNEIRSSN